MKALTNKEAVQAIKNGQQVVAIPTIPVTSEFLIVRYKNALDVQHEDKRNFTRLSLLEKILNDGIFNFYLVKELLEEIQPEILEDFLKAEEEIFRENEEDYETIVEEPNATDEAFDELLARL